MGIYSKNQLFLNNCIGVVEHGDQMWFVAKDIAPHLGWQSNTNNMVHSGCGNHYIELEVINQTAWNTKLISIEGIRHLVSHPSEPDLAKYFLSWAEQIVQDKADNELAESTSTVEKPKKKKKKKKNKKDEEEIVTHFNDLTAILNALQILTNEINKLM
jgi:hypothetical protein